MNSAPCSAVIYHGSVATHSRDKSRHYMENIRQIKIGQRLRSCEARLFACTATTGATRFSRCFLLRL